MKVAKDDPFLRGCVHGVSEGGIHEIGFGTILETTWNLVCAVAGAIAADADTAVTSVTFTVGSRLSHRHGGRRRGFGGHSPAFQLR